MPRFNLLSVTFFQEADQIHETLEKWDIRSMLNALSSQHLEKRQTEYLHIQRK